MLMVCYFFIFLFSKFDWRVFCWRGCQGVEGQSGLWVFGDLYRCRFGKVWGERVVQVCYRLYLQMRILFVRLEQGFSVVYFNFRIQIFGVGVGFFQVAGDFLLEKIQGFFRQLFGFVFFWGEFWDKTSFVECRFFIFDCVVGVSYSK